MLFLGVVQAVKNRPLAIVYHLIVFVERILSLVLDESAAKRKQAFQRNVDTLMRYCVYYSIFIVTLNNI